MNVIKTLFGRQHVPVVVPMTLLTTACFISFLIGISSFRLVIRMIEITIAGYVVSLIISLVIDRKYLN